MAETPEHRLGGFRLTGTDGFAGAGGQGTVRRAVCERADFPGLAVGMTVALKVMTAPVADEGSWRRLEATVGELVRLDAPNVVRYYGCFRERAGVVELRVVVMEFLEGETLKARLVRRPGGLDADEALDAVRAAAAGLGAAAAVGLVHRDVKPDNIFLCSDGSVKVIDFGIARREGAVATTNAAQLLGSFDYMAPERTDTAFRGDECADVFSLGVVLHEALFGRLPYAGGAGRPEFAFFERWSAGARATALSVDRRAGRVVPGLDAVLSRALSVDRADRTTGFSALVSALGRLAFLEIASEDDIYRVVGVIGEGGFGEVFRARRLRDGAVVALKHLKRMDDSAARRFRGEARAMAALDDPAFVRFYEYFETASEVEPQAYLAMACLDGMPGNSLRDRLVRASGLGLSPDLVLAAFARYAHGLAVLHAHGIVHRDIKPSNLYFPDDAERAAIMDLGVALDWKATLTQGMAPGTPDYMPPEVLKSESRGSPASDLYALGFCLYEALTGRTAFPRFKGGSSGSIEAFVIRARQMRAPKLDAPLVAANPELERLLRRMTEPDAARRMSNAAEAEMELLDLLDAFERGEWTIPEQVAPAGEAPTADTAVFEAQTADLRVPTADSPAVPPVSAPPPRRRRVLPAIVAAGLLLLAGAAAFLVVGRKARPAESVRPVAVPSALVVTQVVSAAAVDTNAAARAAAAEERRRELERRLKEAEEARIRAEREAEEAEREKERLRKEQETAKRRQAEEAAAKKKAEAAAQKAEAARQAAEEAKSKLESERLRAAEAARKVEAERKAEAERQRRLLDWTIGASQTAAVAVVHRCLDGRTTPADAIAARAAWVARWKGVHPSDEYERAYERAARLVEDAVSNRIAVARPPAPPKPAPAVRSKPLSADIRRKLEDAEICLDDGDELGALRLYAEVAAGGWAMSDEIRKSSDSAFESYRLKNLEAQEIARTRPNSNYNEGKLKEELRQARHCLKVILGDEKGR